MKFYRFLISCANLHYIGLTCLTEDKVLDGELSQPEYLFSRLEISLQNSTGKSALIFQGFRFIV